MVRLILREPVLDLKIKKTGGKDWNVYERVQVL